MSQYCESLDSIKNLYKNMLLCPFKADQDMENLVFKLLERGFVALCWLILL